MHADYHLAELAIALDPHNPGHVEPPYFEPNCRVLDIGCGAGQTLIASCSHCRSFGLDIDIAAVTLGSRLTSLVRFTCAEAEALPFSSDSFDWVIARVSLPYTDIRRSLQEIHRVLREEGRLWAVLERPSLPVRTGKYRNPMFYALLPYRIVNSVLFNCTSKSIPFLDGKYRGYQTRRGIERALRQANFQEISIEADLHLVAVARKGK